MAIKTKHNIEIEIDDKSFSIVVSEHMSTSQKDELKLVTEKYQGEFAKRDSLQQELNEANQEFDIKKHILDHGGIKDIVKTMFEQKALNKKIFSLRKELADIDKNIVSLSKAMEELYERRFELSVSGDGKAALQKEMETVGLNYQIILAEIGEQVKESKEKK